MKDKKPKRSGGDMAVASTEDDDNVDETSPLLGDNTPPAGFDTISPDDAKEESDTPAEAVPAPAEPPAPAPAPAPAVPPPVVPAPTPSPPPPPRHEAVAKADEQVSWSAPAGLRPRSQNDENLSIFRRAVGINAALPATSTTLLTLEEGRAHATGMYASVLSTQRQKTLVYNALQALVYLSHFLQIILGASLTALGPTAGQHALTITVLGAMNTVIAGVLALVKGQGLPERLRQDRAGFRKLQDWIEQTEALLAVGVIGRDRKEVGLLVQVAFVKYNAAKASEDNNVPENYIRAGEDGTPSGRGG
ncbi:hypothetical protein QBC39DRAFT_296622 [Podospora conica]|nr:hypothetical protein QBC39DRAFT_296622 [Schizothecium conicum]